MYQRIIDDIERKSERQWRAIRHDNGATQAGKYAAYLDTLLWANDPLIHEPGSDIALNWAIAQLDEPWRTRYQIYRHAEAMIAPLLDSNGGTTPQDAVSVYVHLAKALG